MVGNLLAGILSIIEFVGAPKNHLMYEYKTSNIIVVSSRDKGVLSLYFFAKIIWSYDVEATMPMLASKGSLGICFSPSTDS